MHFCFQNRLFSTHINTYIYTTLTCKLPKCFIQMFNIFKLLLIILCSVIGDVNEIIATIMERKGRNYEKNESHFMVMWRCMDLFIPSRNISICNCCSTFNNMVKNEVMEISLFYTYGLSPVKWQKYQTYNQLCNLELQNYFIKHS